MPEQVLPTPGLGTPPVGDPDAPANATRRAGAIPGMDRIVRIAREQRWTILIYLASRLLLLIVAVALARVEHHSLTSELGRWDGTWYGQIASSGYPRHLSPYPTALGFFPLYPLLIWLAVHLPGPPNSVIIAGTLVSTFGGLIATLLVERLAAGWWGVRAGRRAAVLFCFFPGSIVFSMAYAEGLLLPLVAGCLLALQKKRWLLGGVLAGLATAVQPDAVGLVVVAGVCSALEIHRRGWRDRAARASLIAPLLSMAGVASFGAFLWLHTGTPFATLHTQQKGWGERVDPLALVHQGRRAVREISHADIHHLHIFFGPVAAVVGAFVLALGLALLVRSPKKISLEAATWTIVIAVLAIVSENVPPNPRILITAFPAVLVFAYSCRRRQFSWLLATTFLLLVVTSALTYGGRTLTP